MRAPKPLAPGETRVHKVGASPKLLIGFVQTVKLKWKKVTQSEKIKRIICSVPYIWTTDSCIFSVRLVDCDK